MPTSLYLTAHQPAAIWARLIRSSIHSILLALDNSYIIQKMDSTIFQIGNKSLSMTTLIFIDYFILYKFIFMLK